MASLHRLANGRLPENNKSWLTEVNPWLANRGRPLAVLQRLTYSWITMRVDPRVYCFTSLFHKAWISMPSLWGLRTLFGMAGQYYYLF
jgi:hypothetical protein